MVNKTDPCPVAATLRLVGEAWTLLIVREAFFGTRRFADFQRRLGIARNILSDRLGKLTRHGILRRVPVAPGARRHEYRLTRKGLDLLPMLVAMAQWGERWLHEEGGGIRLVDRRDRLPIRPVRVRAADGRELNAHEIAVEFDVDHPPGEG